MTELKTETFSLQVPDELDQHRVMWETIRAESSKVDYRMQNPELNAGLVESSAYDEMPGETFADRFCNNLFERYEDAQLVERLEEEIEGRKSTVQVGRISWEWDGKKADVFYLTAALPMDDSHHYEMKAYCEKEHWDSYRPIFLQTWRSLTTFGDRQEALQKQDEAIEALHSRHAPPQPDTPQTKPFEIPENGRDHFRVDSIELTFAPETVLEVCQLDRTFSVTLKAHVPSEFKDKTELFDDYEVERGVGFRLRLSGIHRAGIPTGRFIFEHGKCNNRDAYLWDDGWEYSLNFNGEVELRDGWIGMNGYLCGQWDQEPVFELELYKEINIDELDWKQYRFTSLLETHGRDPEDVRYLSLTEPGFETFPKRLLSLMELRELTITTAPHVMPHGQKLALNELPPDCSNFEKLTSLHVGGAQLEELPDSLGTLKNLQRLCVVHCELKNTPPSLWRLPNLLSLNLANNELETLPEEIELSKLTHLDLHSNQLKTVPESLGGLETLQQIDLADNPLTSLPESVNRIPEIELPMEDKLRLLDFIYQGADGEGCIPWSEEAYLALSQPQFQSKLSEHELSEALLPVAKLALVLDHEEDEDYSQLGNTRFGGWPDLPPSIPYPRFGNNEIPGKSDYVYEFLGQLNCEQLASHQDYLPRTGLLYFFLDTVHEMNPKVIYWDGPAEDLVSGRTLSFDEDDFFELPGPPYQGYRASQKAEVSLPKSYASYLNTHQFPGPAAALLEPDDLLERVEEDLGLPNRQNSHEINSYIFTQHECPELQAALQKKGRPEDWVVLLKVASVGDFQWWDAGELFFVVHKSDLAKKDFSNIYCGLESS